MKLNRRAVISGLVGFSIPLIASSCTQDTPGQSTPAASSDATDSTNAAGLQKVRIGYQKATDLDLLRTQGELDKRLQSLGLQTEWSLFPAGPPMLEAMNTGNVDYGGVGEAPPIFSQAAGGQFYYVAASTYGPETQDIIAPANSPVQSAADLKGKRIAFTRGSSAHFLLLTVLKEQGIALSDIEQVPLPPADARGAFDQGGVDAWSIWDPFLAVAQENAQVRSLKVGRDRRTFQLATRSFTDNNPEVLKVILEELAKLGTWANENPREVAVQFAKDTGLSEDILEKVNRRTDRTLQPITEAIQNSQQAVADAFFEASIIPQAIQVQEAFLPTEQYAKIFPA